MKRLKFILTSLSCFLFSASLFAALSVSSVFTAKAETTTEEIVCAGASIRLATDGKSGIRFHIRMELDENDKVTLGGTKYTRSEINGFTSGIEITPEGKDPINVRRTGTWHEITDDGVRYLETKAYVYDIGVTDESGEIDTSWYDKQFTFRGYVNTGTVYYSDYQSRSLSEVALAAKYDISSDGEWNGLNAEYIENWDTNKTELTGILNSYLPIRTSVSSNFTNVDKYLYRVGNGNAVELSSLFDSNLVDKIALDETLTCASDSVTLAYENGQLQFEGTGVATLTVKDEYSRVATTLTVEVIDAKNATSATSATSNNVVLLNDVSGTFSVSNGYTFHGNGFTVTLPTDSTSAQSKYSAGFTGYVTLNSGNLDNVRIEGPVYPEMYIYRDQATEDQETVTYFKNSVLINGGNCTISNSYISGSRTALCVRGGNDVVIENTTLSGGAYANLQIAGASSVTLRDLTTEQVDATDSFEEGKTVHGLGVSVDSAVVDLYIEGSLNQYNWLNEEQWDAIIPDTYSGSFPKFFTKDTFNKYWHYLDGGTDPYVNLAFIFACNWDTSRIHDNRETVDYGTCDATIANTDGGVYSKVNTVGGNAITNDLLAEHDYVPTGFNPIAPTFTFDNSPNDDADDEDSSFDEYCVYDEESGTLKIGVTGDSKTLDLSKISVIKNGDALDFTAYLNDTQISGDSVTVKISDGTKQKLTFKAVGNKGYDKDGNAIDGEITYVWNVTVEMATLAYPAPAWNMGGNYQFDTTNCYYAYYKTSQGYGEAVPIYEGIKINYYNASGELVELDLSGTTTVPTGSENSNSNAFTYTLSDGSVLTMKFSSGWKSGATTHQFTCYDSKVYIYPQSLDNDSYVRANKTSQDFDVKISYTFTDPNGQSTGTQTMNWYNAAASNSNVSTVQWKTFDSTNGKTSTVCVTGDTLVTLADGTQQRVDSLTGNEMLLFWNHYTGKLDSAPAYVALHKEPIAKHRVVTLTFSDGSAIEIIGEHVFFDYTLNKYVAIDEDNAKGYLGHTFIGINSANDGLKKVELVSIEVEERETLTYEITTKQYLTCFTDTLLSAPAHCDILLNVFENDLDVMSYNAEQVANDIEAYGLYTYEDFEGLIEETIFDLFNFKYLKIAIGKGYTTWSEVLEWIDTFNSADINQPV